MRSFLAGDAEAHLAVVRGTLALCGASVERAALAGLASVPLDWQKRRSERDGEAGFHISLLTKGDLQSAAARWREVGDGAFASWPEAVPLPDAADAEGLVTGAAQLVGHLQGGFAWVDCGQGYAADATGEAAFRVVCWPGGATARQVLGLPKQDFHVTLGFRGHDVHGCSKGLASLVGGAPDAAAAKQLAGAARQLVEAGRGLSSEALEALASAALRAAEASADASSEASALESLCGLCGRLRRTREVLAYAERLTALQPESELGWRSQAIALLALHRYEAALVALRHCRQLLHKLTPGVQQDRVLQWLTSATDRCCAKLGVSDRLFPGPEDMATAEQDQKFEEAFLAQGSGLKFPSTAHLKNLGAATRDDKVCDERRQRSFCGGARLVSVEEKVDGANLGLSLDSAYQFRMQARSKLVNWKTDPQFAGLERWLEEHRSTLCEVLERNNDILFGEWCAFRHTVKYTRLPGYFLAFDIYDRRVGKFLSRKSFHGRLRRASGPKIPVVPLLLQGHQFSNVSEVEALLERQSSFAAEPLEGVYLRIDEVAPPGGARESYLEDRCKLVRSEFQQAIEEEGTWRGRGKNDLDMDLAMTYTDSCYACAEELSAAASAGLPTEPGAGSAAACPSATAAVKDSYPSTPHLPFSPGVNPDDTSLSDCTHLIREEVVVTEKLDGGNCCIKDGQVYARTHAKPATHESFSAVKQLVQGFGEGLDDGVALYGETMQAVHSIEYTNLTSFFYVFAACRHGHWLSWDEVCDLAARLGLPTVPVVFRGRLDSEERLQGSLELWARLPSAVGTAVTPEGFVVRRAHGFSCDRFQEHVAKYVRAGHIQTTEAWRRTWKKAQLGPALPAPEVASAALSDPLRAKLHNPRVRHKVKVPTLQEEVTLPRNFSFLMDDVAVSSTPKHRDHILALDALGISLVVTLTEEEPLQREWFAELNSKPLGVRNMFVPVPNTRPPTLEQVDAILAAVTSVARDGGKAMVHCGGGKGRAGTVAACLLLRFGTQSVAGGLELQAQEGCAAVGPMGSDEVLRYLRDVRPGSVETEVQEHFIREYASVLWRRAAEVPGAAPLLRAVSEARSEHEGAALAEAQLFSGPADAAAAAGASSSAAAGPGSAAAAPAARRAERAAKEAEKRLREAQRRAPKYLIMVGLAGSGKSTFCKALVDTGVWVRANQDDLGRKGCQELVRRTVPRVKEGKVHLVVDRCNLKRSDRAEWLDLMHKPAAKDVSCVFFDFPAEECKRRAAARENHPTIRRGGGGRIIEDQAAQLERPGSGEGFGAVELVRSFGEARALLQKYGADAGDDAAVPAAAEAAEARAVPADEVEAEEEKEEEVEAVGEAAPPPPPDDDDGAAAAPPQGEVLPEGFALWLREALGEELPAGEAEAMVATVEVILSGADLDPDAVASAVEVLRDAGAARCAESLQGRWSAAG